MVSMEEQKNHLRLLLKDINQKKGVNLYPLIINWSKKGVVMPLDALVGVLSEVSSAKVENPYGYMTGVYSQFAAAQKVKRAEQRNKVDKTAMKSAGAILFDILRKGGGQGV